MNKTSVYLVIGRKHEQNISLFGYREKTFISVSVIKCQFRFYKEKNVSVSVIFQPDRRWYTNDLKYILSNYFNKWK